MDTKDRRTNRSTRQPELLPELRHYLSSSEERHNDFRIFTINPGLLLLLTAKQKERENRKKVLLQQLENRFLDLVNPWMAGMEDKGDVPDLIQLPALVSQVHYIQEELKKIRQDLDALQSPQKPVIVIWAEENGSLAAETYEWSFGNGGEGNAKYGFCMPVSGRVKRASLSATSGQNMTSEVRVQVIVNGTAADGYEILKPSSSWGDLTVFPVPLEQQAEDIVNFKTKTTNSSATHAIVVLLVEIDV